MCSDALVRAWGADSGRVRSVRSLCGGERFYFIKSDVRELAHGGCEAVVAAAVQKKQKEKVIYARASSHAQQRGDLQRRQSADLRVKFPTHVLIAVIASGISSQQRRGLKTILDREHNGTLDELVVAHKDRLCCFAFDLVRDVLARSGCKLVVLGQANEPGGEAEFADDILAIADVFVAKRNGQRSAKTRK